MPKYKIGDIIKGQVTGIEKYGIFLMVENGYSGLIHISEISDNFVRSIFDYVQLKECIYAKVIDIDNDNKRLKLTIKNFNYRIDDKNSLEEKNGFSLLREKLPIWISEYKNTTEK